MRADVFYKTYNRVVSRARTLYVVVEVPETATLGEILAAAFAAGCPRGNRGSGVFEIQTDLGIFDTTTARSLTDRNARYRTWDEIDAEEVAAEEVATAVDNEADADRRWLESSESYAWPS